MSTRPVDWQQIRLVVFDVDGTLYDQRALRRRMLLAMLAHVLQTGQTRFIRILQVYRQQRERLGDARAEDFATALIAHTAAATGCTPAEVQAVAQEWLERRPLPYLARYRYPHLPVLFERLRAQGKRIGVFSDYPARDKLAALGLAAEFIVSATDAEVQVLKPHPRGLQSLMARAGCTPDETVLIGDRADRDGLAARAAGAHALIRSPRPLAGWHTFTRYDGTAFPAAAEAQVEPHA